MAGRDLRMAHRRRPASPSLRAELMAEIRATRPIDAFFGLVLLAEVVVGLVCLFVMGGSQ